MHLRKRRLDTLEDIHASLQGAIRLELATLPPYLTALYSLKPGTNVEIAAILREVIAEEMLHFCLSCNILNAIGGRPTINTPGFAATYPGPLPMDVGKHPGKPFIVPIRRFSIELVRDVFMTIEEPEDPLRFAPGPAERNYHTIGEFYEQIEREIVARGNAIFTGDRKRQVTGRFGPNKLFAVTNVKTAREAIRLIIEQGEGTRNSPLDLQGQLSHYYLLAQIAHGHRWVADKRAPEGGAYSGAKIPFDRDGVQPMVENPALVQLPKNSIVAQYADQFDRTFTTLLNALHKTVNGDPQHIDASVGVMYSLRVEAMRLMTTRIPGTNVNAGPRWRQIPSP